VEIVYRHLARRLAHLGDTFERLEQGVQGRRHLDDHARAASRQQRCVAAELQDVAIALLGMQQQRSAGRVLVAQP